MVLPWLDSIMQIPTAFYRSALLCFVSTIAVSGNPVFADTINVSVVDHEGHPVPDVVVYVEQQNMESSARTAPGRAVVDQRQLRFMPHILVVQTGTMVEFPNSDSVAHHVYSFSKPNNFTLPLYKGDSHRPVTFEHEGIVSLGCNVHDQMLAYIAVVDTDIFGKTDTDGAVTLSVPEATKAYDVSIWSPRIREINSTHTQTVTAGEARHVMLKFSLRDRLRQAHNAVSETSLWSEYR